MEVGNKALAQALDENALLHKQATKLYEQLQAAEARAQRAERDLKDALHELAFERAAMDSLNRQVINLDEELRRVEGDRKRLRDWVKKLEDAMRPPL